MPRIKSLFSPRRTWLIIALVLSLSGMALTSATALTATASADSAGDWCTPQDRSSLDGCSTDESEYLSDYQCMSGTDCNAMLCTMAGELYTLSNQLIDEGDQDLINGIEGDDPVQASEGSTLIDVGGAGADPYREDIALYCSGADQTTWSNEGTEPLGFGFEFDFGPLSDIASNLGKQDIADLLDNWSTTVDAATTLTQLSAVLDGTTSVTADSYTLQVTSDLSFSTSPSGTVAMTVSSGS